MQVAFPSPPLYQPYKEALQPLSPGEPVPPSTEAPSTSPAGPRGGRAVLKASPASEVHAKESWSHRMSNVRLRLLLFCFHTYPRTVRSGSPDLAGEGES